jgi:hypothetical protein
MAKFEPHPHKEEAMQALRNGESAEDVRQRFRLGLRTIARYEAELKNPKPPKAASTTSEHPRPGLTSVPIEPASPSSEGTEGERRGDQGTPASPETPRPVPQTKHTVLDVTGPTLVNFRFYNDPVQINLSYLEAAYGFYKRLRVEFPELSDTFEETVVYSVKNALVTLLRRRSAREIVEIEQGGDGGGHVGGDNARPEPAPAEAG